MFDANETEGKFLHEESGVIVTGCESRSKQQSINQSISNQSQAVGVGQNDNQSINQSAIMQSQAVRVGQSDNRSINQQPYSHRLSE